MENATESYSPTTSNGTIQKTNSYDFFKYPFFTVVIFGILGNSLVIISILKQRCLQKNNYHFTVFQLAICDLGVLVIVFLELVNAYFVAESIFPNSLIQCLVSDTVFIFQVAGICMMLVISITRYRAIVDPLKPVISRQKLKHVCVLVYIIGLVGGYGAFVPLCFMQEYTAVLVKRVLDVYLISCFYFFPTLFLGVIYYKMCRALVKQHKHMKRVCSPKTRSASSFKNLRYFRNRRAFLICFISVLCYAVGNLPISVWFLWEIVGENYLQTKYLWFFYLTFVLRIAGTCSVNPLIYGIMDKKLVSFWKLCEQKRY
jgi:hypothetical protein